MQEHLLGQDTTINVYQDGKVIASLASINTFDLTINTEALAYRFLGESAPKYEMAYNGVEFTAEGNHRNSEFWTLMDSIVTAARHQTPNLFFFISFKVKYPNGQRARMTIGDVAWDPTTVNVAGQQTPVTWRLSGKASVISNVKLT